MNDMRCKPSLITPAPVIPLALLCFLLLPATPARADVSLLMQEALGVSGEATSAGHMSIYFSRICAASPVQVRPCRPGETGIVVAHYPDFGTVHPCEWIAVPLLPFFYGVDSEQNIPLYVNGKIRALMREHSRRQYLRDIVPDAADGVMPPGRWQQMIGVAWNRDTYSFTIRTTAAEDAALIEVLNNRSNKRKFNVLYHNCADFVREVINAVFPQSTRRDALNDFTMTTPKAVARSFTRYAASRPDRLFTISRYGQLSGPIRRSLDNRNYSEMTLVSRKYFVPQLLFKRELLVIFAASYLFGGRFNAHQTYVAYATPEIARLNLAESRAVEDQLRQRNQELGHADARHFYSGGTEADTSVSRGEINSRKEAERRRVFGTKQGWEQYAVVFGPMLRKAIDDGLFADEREVRTFYRDLESQSEPALDAQGALILRVSAYGEDQLLGLTRTNITDEATNPQLAYKLLLVKIKAALDAKDKDREPLESFEADWNLLRELAARSAATFQPRSSRPPRFLVTPRKTTFGQKLKKAFVVITH